MTEYRVLDLFAGLGGFSAAFDESDRWDVTTVEIEERFDPDIQADVFDLRPSDFEGDFDLVVASPPCTQFSIAAEWNDHWDTDGEPQTQAASDSIALVYHTIGLIRGLAPKYWFLENPRGHLRRFIDAPEATVTYCQYGAEYMKPTDLWGNHPPLTYRRCSPGSDCHIRSRSRRGPGDDAPGKALPRDPAERAKVPFELSASIRDATEAALDGDVPLQTTAADWVAEEGES